MSELAMVGIDLGKHSFHLHGQDKTGREVFRKKLSRQQIMRFFSATFRRVLWRWRPVPEHISLLAT